MGWFAFFLLLVTFIATSFIVWRRWIAPWRDVEALSKAVLEKTPPRKFLISANTQSRNIGLALETLVDRQQQIEERYRDGEFSVQAVFGAMLDGLVVVDERRHVRMMNREFRRAFGADEAGVGAPLIEMIRHASIDRLVTEAIRVKEPRRESIQMSRGPSAGREMEVSAVPLGEHSDGTEGAVVLFRDVTQLRQMEEIRRDFVANVSHELRTPLSIFRGYLETLLDDPHQPPGELMRILEVMERHSDRLSALVEDVLSLARLESPAAQLDIAEVRLSEFLREILRDWETRLAAKQLKLKVEVDPDLPTLEADEHRLQEIIYNLLDNAVKYSRPDGEICVRALQNGNHMRISVSDQGVGIHADDLTRIFERFYRVDKARSRELGGTGLGLSIVKHIAQLHGGIAEAQSELGKGTTVSVILPLKQES